MTNRWNDQDSKYTFLDQYFLIILKQKIFDRTTLSQSNTLVPDECTHFFYTVTHLSRCLILVSARSNCDSISTRRAAKGGHTTGPGVVLERVLIPLQSSSFVGHIDTSPYQDLFHPGKRTPLNSSISLNPSAHPSRNNPPFTYFTLPSHWTDPPKSTYPFYQFSHAFPLFISNRERKREREREIGLSVSNRDCHIATLEWNKGRSDEKKK